MIPSSDLPAVFQAYSAAHLVTLGIVAAFTTVLILLTRARWERTARALEMGLAIVLFLCWPTSVVIAWLTGLLTASNMFPLQLCDVAAIIGGIALIDRKPLPCALLYFWGLAGTLQGLVTPALVVTWPHPRYIAFFVLHGAVVAAALQIVIGRRITPQPGAVLRAMGWLLVYAVVAGTADFILVHLFHQDVNYGFLCAKPSTASILDALGPWPWYIPVLILIATAFFAVLNLPFVIKRRLQK